MGELRAMPLTRTLSRSSKAAAHARPTAPVVEPATAPPPPHAAEIHDEASAEVEGDEHDSEDLDLDEDMLPRLLLTRTRSQQQRASEDAAAVTAALPALPLGRTISSSSAASALSMNSRRSTPGAGDTGPVGRHFAIACAECRLFGGISSQPDAAAQGEGSGTVEGDVRAQIARSAVHEAAGSAQATFLRFCLAFMDSSPLPPPTPTHASPSPPESEEGP